MVSLWFSVDVMKLGVLHISFTCFGGVKWSACDEYPKWVDAWMGNKN